MAIIKTSRDIATSLRGSAFRRLTCDHRSRFARRVRTLADLPGRPASSLRGRGTR